MSIDMGQADRTLRNNDKQTDDGVFARHRARVQALTKENEMSNQGTTALYDADGEVRVGDVVHYGKKPCFIERWDGKFVTVTTMDEKKLMIRLWPKQLGLVVGSGESVGAV